MGCPGNIKTPGAVAEIRGLFPDDILMCGDRLGGGSGDPPSEGIRNRRVALQCDHEFGKMVAAPSGEL